MGKQTASEIEEMRKPLTPGIEAGYERTPCKSMQPIHCVSCSPPHGDGPVEHVGKHMKSDLTVTAQHGGAEHAEPTESGGAPAVGRREGYARHHRI